MDRQITHSGLSIGNNFQNSGINNLQIEDFVKGLKDVLSGAQPEIPVTMKQTGYQRLLHESSERKTGANKKAGEEFLNINVESRSRYLTQRFAVSGVEARRRRQAASFRKVQMP